MMSTPRPPLPDSYEGLQARAQSLAQAGDLKNAIAVYRRLVERLGRLSDSILVRRPELGELHRQSRIELINMLASEGRYAEAIEVGQILLETDPEKTELWRRNLAVLRIAKGEAEEGLAELRTLAEETPDEPDGWIVLGAESRLAGRLAESQKALDRALEACPTHETDKLTNAHYQRFLLYKEMRQVDDALDAWEETVAYNPEAGRTVREVYTMLTEVGRYGEAKRFIARDENALQAGFQEGLVASMTGQPDQAKVAWRQVADLDPGEFEYGHDAWVEAVLRLGNPEPALEWLQDALPRYGTSRLLVLSGIGWAMRDDAELSRLLLQRAIDLRRRERPPKQKLDSADWRLLDSLVADDEVKAPLKSFFAIIDTLWG
jgi:tetratricopeptide (TPR) repeat protein